MGLDLGQYYSKWHIESRPKGEDVAIRAMINSVWVRSQRLHSTVGSSREPDIIYGDKPLEIEQSLAILGGVYERRGTS